MQAQVRPENILRELEELWASLGEQAGGPESHGVLRSCTMTLVVATRQAEDAPAVRETLAGLIREHPSRVILLCLPPKAEPQLEARATAECWLPFGARQQICCERIELVAAEAILPDLPALLLALAAPGLPVVLWCRQASLTEVAGFQGIVAVAHKLILDSSTHPKPAAILAQMAGLPAVADLTWTRLTGWRQMIARFFDDVSHRKRLAELVELRISCAGQAVPVAACYLAAWVIGVTGELRLRFEPRPSGSGVQGLTLATADWSVSLDPSGLAEPAEASLLREELAIAGRDPVYDTVLRRAAQLAGRQWS